MLKIIIVSLIFLAAIGGFLAVNYQEYDKTVSANTSFYLDEDFDTVRKTLVRTPAADELTNLQYGHVLESELTPTNFKLSSGWQLSLAGYSKIKSKQGIMLIKEDIKINPDLLHHESRLLRPTGTLHDMQSRLVIRRWGNKTRVDNTTAVRIKFHSLSFLEKRIDKEVRDQLSQDSKTFEPFLRHVIKKYAYPSQHGRWRFLLTPRNNTRHK